MELNEFKAIWQSGFAQDKLTEKYNSEKINEIIMKSTITITKLHSTNTIWWNIAKISTLALIGSLALNIITFLVSPERFSKTHVVLPFFAIIALFSLITLWLYYEKVKIFEIKDALNMQIAIDTSIRRFQRFYIFSNIITMVMYPGVFYVGTLLIKMGFSNIHFVWNAKEVLRCVVLTVVVMGAEHWYHKKTYFKWLTELKNNLQELRETKN